MDRNGEIDNSTLIDGDFNTPLLVMYRITWESPGGPVVRTPHFHCRGHRLDPWSGN